MNADTQAVLLNAVPLLLLAALYLAVGVAIAPADWRRRGRRGEALVLPLVGAAAAILGIAVLVEREPLAGNAALSLVGIAVAALPLALVLRDRAAGQIPADSLSVTPQIADMNGLSRRLLSADDPRRVAVMLLDELTARHDLELASLALVEDEGRRAVVAAAREGGADIEALLAQEIDLDREASGISAALREGAPFAVYDAEASEVVNKRLNEIAKAKSCAFVPVRAGEGIIGVVFAAVRRPRLFDEQELAQMDAVTALAGLALERTRLLRERTRQAHAERAFYRMAAALSEPLSAEETLDAVAQAAAEALGGDSAAVLRREAHGLELAGRYELAETLAVHLRAGGDALVECCRGGNVLAARSLRGDGRFGPALADAAEAADRRSLLLVPLADAARGEGGLVLVFFREERDFGDDVLELATQVGAAAHGAIERSNLYERERRSRSLAQRLAHAGRGLAGELDPDDVLDRTVQLALDLVGADGASVRVLEGDEVVVRAAAGPGAEDVLETHAPSTGWLVGDIVQTRTTRSIQDVREDARHVEADPMLEAGYAAYLGVPVIGPEESVRGVLAVYASQPRDWREEEVEALSALASSAAAAGANAELYQGVSHEQQRSEAILANVADGIVAVDREGRVVLWNPAAERVTGVPAAEALGRTPTEALGRSLDAEGGVPGGSRLLPIRRGGEEVWLSLSEAVMTDPAGAVAGRIYAFRDISAERSVEQMKSDFVSTVSHELRTPLTSIYGFAETLLRQDVLFGEDERATFLRYISSESERLTAIVDRLLSVAELDTGAIAVQLAETDVGAVVGEAVRSVESADGANGHRFVVELADEPLAAEADGEKLGQVLAHLLDNAVRYSPAGGTVTVAARRRDDAVEVSVEDEGVGIPHAERERIFRKFYRGEGASSATVGAGAAGLGLFLAEGLVKAMGGRIWVDSNEGQGSTFRFVLPAAESET